MSFFDDIDTDINIEYENKLAHLYSIITINDVYNINDMVEYIINISGIYQILKLMGDQYNIDSINSVISNFNFKKLISSYYFEYKVHRDIKGKYVVAPINDKDVRLRIIFRSYNIIYISYWLDDKWHDLIYYMYSNRLTAKQNINKIKVELISMKESILKQFKEDIEL